MYCNVTHNLIPMETWGLAWGIEPSKGSRVLQCLILCSTEDRLGFVLETMGTQKGWNNNMDFCHALWAPFSSNFLYLTLRPRLLSWGGIDKAVAPPAQHLESESLAFIEFHDGIFFLGFHSCWRFIGHQSCHLSSWSLSLSLSLAVFLGVFIIP